MGNNSPKTGFNLLQMLGDVAFLNIATILAFLIRFQGELPSQNFKPYLTIFPIVSVMALLLFNFYGLYHTANKTWSEVLASLMVSISIIMICTIALSYMFQGFSFPRSVLLIAPVVQFAVIGFWRWRMLQLERKLIPPKRILLIATGLEADIIAKKLNNDRDQVLGVVTGCLEDKVLRTCQVLGTYDDVEQICRNTLPDALFMPGAVPEDVKNKVVMLSLKYGFQIYVIPGIYEIMVSQSKLDQIQDTPVFEIGLRTNPGKEQIKRWMDCAIAGIGLVIALPIMLIIAIAIKVDSAGPVLYRQVRVSKSGKKFNLYKFRTMVNDAEKKTGPILATEGDSRITRVGKLLRAVRLDEIPQLFNVLKGDMSIVGPRPERPFFVEQFEKEIPEYTYRHLMKAGITGLAQIAGCYSTSVEDKLRYDLLYAKGASPLFDLRIMLQTIKVLLMRDKAS